MKLIPVKFEAPGIIVELMPDTDEYKVLHDVNGDGNLVHISTFATPGDDNIETIEEVTAEMIAAATNQGEDEGEDA